MIVDSRNLRVGFIVSPAKKTSRTRTDQSPNLEQTKLGLEREKEGNETRENASSQINPPNIIERIPRPLIPLHLSSR